MKAQMRQRQESRSITSRVVFDLEDAPEMRYVTSEYRRAQHHKVLVEVDYPAVPTALRVHYSWINGAWQASGKVYGHILNPRTRERYSYRTWKGGGVTWGFGYGQGSVEEMPKWVQDLVARHTPDKPDLTGWVD